MLSFLENSTDIHIHCCPHINKRSTDIFEVIKFAEKSKMYAIGLMDNFSNTSGYASLVKKNFPNLVIGLSDHTETNHSSIGAVALGACIIEKHFVDKKSRKGPDIKSSIDEKKMGAIIRKEFSTNSKDKTAFI